MPKASANHGGKGGSPKGKARTQPDKGKGKQNDANDAQKAADEMLRDVNTEVEALSNALEAADGSEHEDADADVSVSQTNNKRKAPATTTARAAASTQALSKELHDQAALLRAKEEEVAALKRKLARKRSSNDQAPASPAPSASLTPHTPVNLEKRCLFETIFKLYILCFFS